MIQVLGGPGNTQPTEEVEQYMPTNMPTTKPTVQEGVDTRRTVEALQDHIREMKRQSTAHDMSALMGNLSRASSALSEALTYLDQWIKDRAYLDAMAVSTLPSRLEEVKSAGQLEWQQGLGGTQ